MLEVLVRIPPLGVISLGIELLKATTFWVYVDGDLNETSLCDSSTITFPISDSSFLSFNIILTNSGILF
jgi:hypothetical protein